jgi:hypothetical protein
MLGYLELIGAVTFVVATAFWLGYDVARWRDRRRLNRQIDAALARLALRWHEGD